MILTSAAVFIYTIALTALTISQHLRGNRVWTAPVHQVDFFAPPASPVGGAPLAGGVEYDSYEEKAGQLPLLVRIAELPPAKHRLPQTPGIRTIN